MNKERKRYLFGDFTPDLRFIKLCDRLQEYYTSTPQSVSNRMAMIEWRKFKEWSEANGYSSIEINRAKKARMYKFD